MKTILIIAGALAGIFGTAFGVSYFMGKSKEAEAETEVKDPKKEGDKKKTSSSRKRTTKKPASGEKKDDEKKKETESAGETAS